VCIRKKNMHCVHSFYNTVIHIYVLLQNHAHPNMESRLRWNVTVAFRARKCVCVCVCVCVLGGGERERLTHELLNQFIFQGAHALNNHENSLKSCCGLVNKASCDWLNKAADFIWQLQVIISRIEVISNCKFEVLTVLAMKSIIFCNVTTCSLVEVYCCFRVT
jgi:hypothetical protein